MSSQPIHVMVRWVIRAGHEQEVLGYLDEVARETRLEPGNIRYEAFRSADNPSTIFLYETYASAEAAAYHKASEHYLHWVAGKIVPLLEQREVSVVESLF